MPHANFIHLRIHSAYSLSEGAIKIPEIAELCVRERMPAVAVTDTSNLFGALEFSTVCAERGIQPIIGCQINLTNSLKPFLNHLNNPKLTLKSLLLNKRV